MPGMDGYELAESATRMRNCPRMSGTEPTTFPFIQKLFLESDLKRTMAQHTGLC